jgi:hypothetical protein
MMKKINAECRFFAKGSCRDGNNCRFLHTGAPSQGGDFSGASYGQKDGQYSHGGQRSHGNQGVQGNQRFEQQPQQMQQMDYGNTSFSSNSGPQGSTNSKLCGYFLKGACNKSVCRYFHGYSENLQNAQIEKIHDKNIVSLSLINEKKFISADENTIKIWMITESEHQMIGTQTFNDEKITKVIYSNEKVIAATLVEKMYDALFRR